MNRDFNAENRYDAPLLGEHTYEILAEAGFQEAEIQSMIKSSAVGSVASGK